MKTHNKDGIYFNNQFISYQMIQRWADNIRNKWIMYPSDENKSDRINADVLLIREVESKIGMHIL